MRELLKQRTEREKGLQQKKHEYGRFRLIVVVIIGFKVKKMQDGWMGWG
jgi:hypothetical protein